ncbi:Ig-like domain-containing protein [Candidatus Symbiopectobacterium sp. 'North America']|uniref:Ig-like domain-containing protein n=1 Tax=Candidatus Symbiopectobacterium sp. 'North America' TaxID=2794574 RepID=UPI0018CB9707|nr:Ig-like domain-containing protein [Candidatus Symbiopectobacterium sp. 'North America']
MNSSSTQEKNPRFNGDINTAVIERAWVEKDNAIADDEDYVELRSRVIDANGNVVEGVTVSPSWSSNVTFLGSTRTDTDGISTHRFKSKVAGVKQIDLRTLINGTFGPLVYLKPVFIADNSMATIADADFTAASGALANGTDSNMLSVVVKDGLGNVVPDITVTFALTSGSATLTTPTAQTNTQGVAQATLTSWAAGDNQVTAAVGTHTTAAQTSTFKPGAEFTGISANGHTFTIDDGFPTTGFHAATFTLNVSGNASAYTWNSNQPGAVTINNGQITLNNPPSGSVTITATPTNGLGEVLSYSFTVNSWFTNDGSTTLNWTEANQYCNQQPGFNHLTRAQYNHTSSSTRRVGALWAEWGNLRNYTDSGFSGFEYWTADGTGTGGNNYYVNISFGSFYSSTHSTPRGVIYHQGL